MIFSTHRLTSVVEMDEIIVISGGRAIERGSHASCSPPGGYRKLWDDQSRKPHHAGETDDDDDDDDEDDED